MKQLKQLILLVLCTVVGISCQRDDLCYDHPHYPKIKIEVDLSNTAQTFGNLQSYRVIFYPIDDGVMPLEKLKPIEHTIQSASDFYFSIAPGRYKVVLFNNYESGNQFYNTDSYENICVKAVSSNPIYRGNTRSGLELMPIPEPDVLVVANMDELVVGSGDSPTQQVATFVAREVTEVVNISIVVNGLKYAKSVSAQLGEVFGTHFLTSDNKADSECLLLLQGDSYKLGSNGVDGVVTINGIRTFGLKRDAAGNFQHNYIYLDFLMIDNTSITAQLDLAEYLNGVYDDSGLFNLTLGSPQDPFDAIELPEIKLPVGGGDGGFGADVSEWGDEIEIPLELQ